MKLVALCALAGCGAAITSPAPARDPIAERARTETVIPARRCNAPNLDNVPFHSNLYGAVCDERGEWLAGVIVVIESPILKEPIEAITGEDGVWWARPLTAGSYRVSYYYAELPDVAQVIVREHPTQVRHEMGS